MLHFLKKSFAVILSFVLAIELCLQIAAFFTQRLYHRESMFAKPGVIRILCVGDSNTYGLYLPSAQSWPSQLGLLLEAHYPGQYQVINLGFPGTPTYRIAESLPGWIRELHPDKVYFLSGVNDALYGTVPAANPDGKSPEKAYRFVITHIRLFRLYQSIRNRLVTPVISNDADPLLAAMASLRTFKEPRLSRQVAKIYESTFSYEGLSVTYKANQYWLEYAGKRVAIRPVAQKMQAQDIYSQLRTLMEPFHALGIDLRSVKMQGGLRINHLEPTTLSPIGQAGLARDLDVVSTNIATAMHVARDAGVDFELLTYASDQSFYGQANGLIRQTAQQFDIPIIDLEAILWPQCPSAACQEFFFPDYHPNAEGYRRIAGIIAEHDFGITQAATGH